MRAYFGNNGPRPSRRGFLKGASATAAAFVLAGHLPLGRHAAAADNGAREAVSDPNVFVRVGEDNTITVLLKHFEMGQGVTTGLPTLAAEEMEADWAQMRFAFAPADAELYNNLFFGPYQGTGGSTSIANSWEQMRKVGAAARVMFTEAAARRWNVPADEISVENGVFMHAESNREATYGDLAGEARGMPVPEDVTLKEPKDWKLIGREEPLPRLDSPDKTIGKALFSLDVRRPGMLTAVVRRPEQFGATVASFDASEAKKVKGVVDVVQIPGGIAVLAQDTWVAMKGRDALQVEWDTSRASSQSDADLLAEYREMAEASGLAAARRGDAAEALERADRTVESEFVFPFLAHAPMEPMNGTMELREDGAEIWSASQLQSIDQAVAAEILGLKPKQVTINTLLSGGSFGRRATPDADWTAELAHIVRAIDGRAPVHLVWTREDDIRGGYYRPMALHRVKAGIDAKGNLSGWHHKIVCKSITRGTPFEEMMVENGIDHASVEGVSDTPYGLPDLVVESFNAKAPMPVLWWRSVGHTHTAQVMETMMDELAHAAGRDPVDFRLALLADQPRMAGVLRLAAEKGAWGESMPEGKGRGIAVHRSFSSYVAMVADVSVDGDGEAAKVDRIVAAVDCGVAVNPDVIAAQVEGAVGFTLSTVLRNRLTLVGGRVQEGNFDTYIPTRMSEMPKVEVHIADSGEAPSGIGEPGVPVLAPAVSNAVFAATGKRHRSLPLEGGEAT
jgi:isoquinoline 1-oxidoreductase beta subunit